MAQDMFRPPANRAMKVLDKAFFQKHIPVSAARVLNNTDISRIRSELERSKDGLNLPRYQNVQPDPTSGSDRRCVLLRPQKDDTGHEWPWSPLVKQLETKELIQVIPYEIHLNYKYWTYQDLAEAILPSAVDDDIPSSFQCVGHIAHLNLRERFWPYKDIIGQLILDKNPGIKGVINKIDDVGQENEYRTFKYEVLAGEADMNVEVKEQGCIFRFDYSRVYWNSRLGTEHERLVDMFKEGEAVCDVMAGIGPFALPAGKKRVFAWANDLNPDSFRSLESGIRLNKVQSFVRPFNEDGHGFIKRAARALARENSTVTLRTPKPGQPKASRGKKASDMIEQSYMQPKTFSHFVMNLPATALDFLPDFIGLYDAETQALLPSDAQMPMIHCYCFDAKSEDADHLEQSKHICEEVSKRIGHVVTLDTPGTTVYDVRRVAPTKSQYCVSFRLPEPVAFRKV